MSAVVFLSGTTMGDALGGIGRSFRETFEKLGYTFIEINLSQTDGADALNRTLAEAPIEFVFTFVGMGMEMQCTLPDGSQANLWEAARIPFISLYGDTPAYFFDRHVMPKGPFASLYAFPEHCALRKRLPKVNGLIGVGPPLPLDVIDKSSIDFGLKKTGKLLFFKNGNDPDKLVAAWRSGLPTSSFLMLTDLASELAGQIHTTLGNDIDSLVLSYFLTKGLDIEALTNLRLLFVAQLDDYLRRVKSTFIAESLLDLPVVIYGYNWEHIDFSGRSATYVHGGNYGKSKDLIRDSLGILDMSPNTGMAPHERPLRAFGMYTLCLTNEQEFFRQHFSKHDEFIFRFEKESLQTKVADAVSHPGRYVELGIDVAASFQRQFTPEGSAQFLLDTAAQLRLAYGSRPSELPNYFVWPPVQVS
jgi:hypothetical protein